MLRYLLPVLACALPLTAATAPRPIDRHASAVPRHAPAHQAPRPVHAPRPLHAPRPIHVQRPVYRHVQPPACPPAYRPIVRACPPAPCASSVWIAATWHWTGCSWVWQEGYWTQPVAAPRRGTSISVNWRW